MPEKWMGLDIKNDLFAPHVGAKTYGLCGIKEQISEVACHGQVGCNPLHIMTRRANPQ